jgi:hypothetical protein
LKLFNDISLFNINGVIIFNILISTIAKELFSTRDDKLILIFKKNVKRVDIFLAKCLAFFVFYILINFFSFVLPFSIFYYLFSPIFILKEIFFLSIYLLFIGPLATFSL